jgi:hypothetical protein
MAEMGGERKIVATDITSGVGVKLLLQIAAAILGGGLPRCSSGVRSRKSVQRLS